MIDPSRLCGYQKDECKICNFTVLEEKWGAGSTLAASIKTIIGQVIRYCVSLELTDGDPTRDLKGALTPTQAKHMAAITIPQEIGALIDCKGTIVTRAALKMAAFTFVSPGEHRHSEWAEIDFDRKCWIIAYKAHSTVGTADYGNYY